jgi:hypothetical protein
MTTGLWPYAPEASTATFTPSALSKLSASHVRHPSFNGLRADKPTATIVRETALAAGAATRPASTIKVTNPHLTARITPASGCAFAHFDSYGRFQPLRSAARATQIDPLLPFEGAGPLAYKQSFGSRAPAGQAGLKPDEGHGGAVTRSSVSGLPPTSPWVN